MSVCGQNAVFYGHTYSKYCNSGVKQQPVCGHREQARYSMETQRTNSDITTNPVSSHINVMADHHSRPYVGHHGLNGLPTMMDHWPSPPMAHNHHLNNSGINAGGYTGNNSINNNNNNNNSMLGSCIQNQCNLSEVDATMAEQNNNNNNNSNNNNNNSSIMKNGECPIISTENHKNNNNNNSGSTNNGNSNNSNTTTSSSESTGHSDADSPNARQNQVGTIVLHGVAIVSLIIDNKERLCLAQISNTLLKEYSYNEIHNRRVALGITCVQCTPVQLEILRRAGAMPVSSRRCGMITKREAERLVKSFLEDNDPPKLPEDFAFDVIHECGWGCRGLFEPARYNSSRAKCIKCIYCSMYFSPNKFIFHFHRTPGAKYNHPDAANFNSWRRHLKLNQTQDKDEFTFKWEDVKAMFNGGTRKRIGSSATSSTSSTSPSSSALSSKFSSHLSTSSNSHSSSSNNVNNPHHHHPHHQTTPNRSTSAYQHSSSLIDGASNAKKAKTSSMVDTNSFLPKPAPFSNPFTPYGWLGASTPNKAAAYPFMTMNSAQSMCFGFPPHMPSAATNNKETIMERMKSAPVGVGNAHAWMNRNPVLPFQLASMDLLWDKTFGFPSAAAVAALGGFRNGSYPNSIFPGASAHMGMDINEHLSPPRDNTPCMSPNSGMPQKLMSPGIHERGDKPGIRTSAFTRVVPSMSPPSSASLSPQNSNIDRTTPNSRNCDDDDDENENNDIDDGAENCHDGECDTLVMGDGGFGSHKDIDDTEEIDVEDHSEDKKRLKCNNNNNNIHNNVPLLTLPQNRDSFHGQSCNNNTSPQNIPMSRQSLNPHRLADKPLTNLHQPHRSTVVSPSSGTTRQLSLPSSPRSDVESRSNGRASVLSGVSDSDRNYVQPNLKDDIKDDNFGDEVKSDHDEPKEELENAKQLPDKYSDEISREKSFQEHMSKQLEMLRETLTTELEQERKIRYSLQEKLKQAHEALNSFSCGLVNPNGDTTSNHFKDTTALPR